MNDDKPCVATGLLHLSTAVMHVMAGIGNIVMAFWDVTLGRWWK